MVDHVIVTVETNTQKKDMELPDKISVELLSKKLLEVLKELIPMEFREKEQIDLYFENIRLNENKSLREQYVWDGSILKVM